VTGGDKAGKRLRRGWPKSASMYLHSARGGFAGTVLQGASNKTPITEDLVLSDEERTANDRMTLCCSRAKSPVLLLDL